MIPYLNYNPKVEELESLRIPFENISCPTDWKDWYHYIFIEPNNGTKILMNITLSGRPGAGEIQVSLVIKQKVESGQTETFAEVKSVPWEPEMVKRYPLKINASNLLFQIKDGLTSLAVEGKNQDIHLEITAKAKADPFLIDEQAKFGKGFIGWGFIPGMAVEGSYSVCGKYHRFSNSWYCYHDRNFGRFRWGEDIGWEWIVAHFTGSGNISYQVVFDQRTNKDHTAKGFPYIFIFSEFQLKKVFVGNTLRLKWNRREHARRPLRLPGNMASAFAHQISAEIESVELIARDDRDFIHINLQSEKAFELIVPDCAIRQYSVMEEISGKAFFTGSFSETKIHTQGHFYAEFVR